MTTSIAVAPERRKLLRAYETVRSTTEALCEPLEAEDMVVQTMPDVSPTKWHLAHVTWFFETLALERSGAAYARYDDRFDALFNSYYQSLGDPYPRPDRGLLSRPTVEQVRAYRRHVDDAMGELLEEGPDEAVRKVAPVVTVGLNHEQQHQELLLMDVKNVLARNPLRPAYRARPRRRSSWTTPVEWRPFEGGQVEVGSEAGGFTFDNERPRHTVFLEPFELASRPVTAGEYRAFMADGGYERHDLWLADGWDRAQREGWRAPLYWEEDGGSWRVMTLSGMHDVDPGEPVCHVSLYEADAYARWAGCRLPTEFEWEHAAGGHAVVGTFLESGEHHPRPMGSPPEPDELAQLFGDVWEWTASPYAPYPGYEPFEGELGEYNGKFMINQMVLRGGCCVTPERHLRRTYRNFYYPHQRWMFAGFRLAR
jgi:ergothioneine biosynthesis protein EgtB